MPLLPFSATPPALLQEAPQDVHPVIVAPVTGPAHAHPKHPVRGAHPRALRLRWLHTAIAIHDDLANR
jgi:hypothetical protein